MNLKKTLAALLLSLIAVSVFASGENIVGGRDGSCSRKEFIEACSDEDQMYSVVELYARGAEIRRFERVPLDRTNDADKDVLNDIVSYITKKYTVKNGDFYSHILASGKAGGGTEGCLVLSHYASSAGEKWFHTMYYFEIAN